MFGGEFVILVCIIYLHVKNGKKDVIGRNIFCVFGFFFCRLEILCIRNLKNYLVHCINTLLSHHLN